MAASPTRSLIPNELMALFPFFNPQELSRMERVCRAWRQTTQVEWKRRYQTLLNVDFSVDLKTYFPTSCSSCKEALLKVFSKILGPENYRSYLGAKVTPPPKAALTAFCRKFNQPDPCDPKRTIGEEYYLVYSPPDLTVTITPKAPFWLDKDTLRKGGGIECFIKRLRVKTEETATIPSTINNISELFRNASKGSPSYSDHVWERAIEQHGDKRIPSGWICVRENPFQEDYSFAEQRAAALKVGVEIGDLGTRMLFNFLRHTATNVYPDAQGLGSYVRTSTLVGSVGLNWSVNCGGDNQGSLAICRDIPAGGNGEPGIAVVLPLRE
jgi:hypothetical protein